MCISCFIHFTPHVCYDFLWHCVGAGKSYRAEQEAEEDGRSLYRQNGTAWWDGYDADPLVIIDDFSETNSFRETLKILDVYNYLAAYKGGHCWLKAEKIWVTASFPPSKIDQGGQIERRCTTIVNMMKADRPDIRSLFAKQSDLKKDELDASLYVDPMSL